MRITELIIHIRTICIVAALVIAFCPRGYAATHAPVFEIESGLVNDQVLQRDETDRAHVTVSGRATFSGANEVEVRVLRRHIVVDQFQVGSGRQGRGRQMANRILRIFRWVAPMNCNSASSTSRMRSWPRRRYTASLSVTYGCSLANPTWWGMVGWWIWRRRTNSYTTSTCATSGKSPKNRCTLSQSQSTKPIGEMPVIWNHFGRIQDGRQPAPSKVKIALDFAGTANTGPAWR